MSIEDKPLNYGHGYDDSNSIAIIWCIDDVKSIRPDLSDNECMEVLSKQEHKHDASMGVSWDTLEWYADYLFPKKEVSGG
jgi:hypothetical protein